MLMFLGYLFMSGITGVKAAEGFNFSNTGMVRQLTAFVFTFCCIDTVFIEDEF